MTQPSALSREQVVKECDWLIQEHCDSAARKWRDTDAAQRATIEQQAQEIERLTVELLAARSACEAWGNQVVKEREQLAAMRQEREARIAELESKL